MATWTCDSCGGANPPGTRFCGHCGSPAPAPAPIDVAPNEAAVVGATDGAVADALRAFVAGPVADRLSETGGRLTEERRLVTALFADLSGFTPLADRLDPEALLDVIDPLVSALSDIVGHYEGYVEKFAGDALLALFGAPVAHEDDAARALHAALEMHRSLPALRGRLPEDAAGLTLHIGVNTGHGIARVIGSNVRMDYAVLGDAVILAQRLESAAPPGETYVGDTTHRLVGPRFAFEPVGPLTLKGVTDTVSAWRLVGEQRTVAPSTTVAAGGAPLVGRSAEVARATAFADAVTKRSGATLEIVGEAGIGKSRLVDAIRSMAEAGGARWLEARCVSYGAGIAYRPFADLLRREVGIGPEATPDVAATLLQETLTALGIDDLFEPLARLIGAEAAPSDGLSDPEARRRELHDALRAWLGALGAAGPVAIALEDAHWADPSSVEIAREFAAAEDLRLGLVVTSRVGGELAGPTEPGLASTSSITLGPLDDGGVAEILSSILGGPPAQYLVRAVASRAGGNPFFVGELARALVEAGDVVVGTSGFEPRPGWISDDVPPTIEGVLAARIDRLPAATTRMLGIASVLGRRVDVDLLAEVAAEPVGTAVGELSSAGLLDAAPDGTFQFHHALVQDVAYARLLRRQRRDVHRRAAAAVERLYGSGDDVIDDLARHHDLGETGLIGLPYLARAGERARRLFANHEAIRLFGRVVELSSGAEPAPDDRHEYELILADLLDLVGDYPAARERYEAVRAATDDPRAYRGLAAVARKLGDAEGSLAAAEAGIARAALVGADDRPIRLELSWSLANAGHLEDAIEVLRPATAQDAGDEVAIAVLTRLARSESAAGRHGDAEGHVREALARPAVASNERLRGEALRVLGSIELRRRHLDAARAAFQAALDSAERAGSVEEIAGCLLNLGTVADASADAGAAVDAYRRAADAFARIANLPGVAQARSNLADVLVRDGQLERAELEAEAALALARRTGAVPIEADTLDTLGLAARARGEHAVAAEHAEAAAAAYRRAEEPGRATECLAMAADEWEAAGEPGRAERARISLAESA